MTHAIRTAALLASFALTAPALAQSSNSNQGAGVTSGPASGSPTTLGTGGDSAASKHQTESMKDKGGPAIRDEKQGQAGGTNSSVKPGVPDQESGSTTRKPPQ